MPKRKKLIEFECQTCGKKFEVNASDHRIKEGKQIKYCSHACAGMAIRTGETRPCPICGKLFYTTRNEFCSPECGTKGKMQRNTHKTYMENGYICHYVNGYNKKGNVKQHRLVMENHLGRRLSENEVVHHKNGDKTDNSIDNLEVMTRSEHNSLHRKKEKAEGKHLFGGYHNN